MLIRPPSAAENKIPSRYGPTLEDAIEVLSTTYRYELRDSAFGDCEVHWVIRPYGDTDPNAHGPVADGYVGNEELNRIRGAFISSSATVPCTWRCRPGNPSRKAPRNAAHASLSSRGSCMLSGAWPM